MAVHINGAKLQVEAARRGLSLQGLARKAGVDPNTVRRAVRGCAMRPETLHKLARVMHQVTVLDDDGGHFAGLLAESSANPTVAGA